jgi:5-methylcytosine-specific restriction endonuclease McrA
MTRDEALAAGLNRFFTGVPCRNGHVCERIASTNKCVECHKANKRRYDTAHPDRKRQRSRNWQSRNREKVRETNRLWAAANPDKVRERTARGYAECAKNQIKVSERAKQAKRWRQANPDKRSAQSSRWQAANPDKVAATQHAIRARKRGAKGKFTKADIDRLFALQGGKCASAWCKKSIEAKREIDHVIPLALGGCNDVSNLQLLCPTCNRRKWAKHPIDFAQENGMLL